MAEETPSLHIDTDWKKQAQEEKRRLAEQEAKKAAEAKPSVPAGSPRAGGGRAQREVPPATFSTLINTILTQALLYLGELAPQGGEGMINLDMAKHQIDTLTMLEQKTKNNLSEEEQRFLDTALYETTMRFFNVASQYI